MPRGRLVNAHDEKLFYDVFVMICAAMALVNLARLKSRGISAVLLAAAFLVFGATVFAYSSAMPTPVIAVGGVIVFALLAADMFFKVRNHQS